MLLKSRSLYLHALYMNGSVSTGCVFCIDPEGVLVAAIFTGPDPTFVSINAM